MTDRMDYRELPTRLQEHLFGRWLKQVKKHAVEFRAMAEDRYTTDIHSPLCSVSVSEWEGKPHLSLFFERGERLEVCQSGYRAICKEYWSDECRCPSLILYSYRADGSPEWHDYEDWLADLGLDFKGAPGSPDDWIAAERELAVRLATEGI